MTLWIHSAVLATTIAATAAIGIAGASSNAANETAAPKADRLPVVAVADDTYVTVETRRDGVSVLSRIAVASLD